MYIVLISFIFYNSEMTERQWNPHVKKTLGELRQYAFINNEDFKNGFVDGYEVTKTYHHADPRLLGSRFVDFEPDLQSTEFQFSVYRQPEHINGRATYRFALGALVTRALDTLEPYLEMQLGKDMKKDLKEFNLGDLVETFSLQFKANELNPSKILTRTGYSVSLYDNPLYDTDESDFQHLYKENFIRVPDAQTKRKTKKEFVPVVIEHEQYPLEMPRLINDAAFEAIVGSIKTKKDMQSIPVEDAAQRMSAVLSKFQTGRLN